jgi:hypothetical protein
VSAQRPEVGPHITDEKLGLLERGEVTASGHFVPVTDIGDGLISTHGILIVEVANAAQAEGKSKLEAIIYAAGIRLKLILMNTSAMVLSVRPCARRPDGTPGRANRRGHHAPRLRTSPTDPAMSASGM